MPCMVCNTGQGAGDLSKYRVDPTLSEADLVPDFFC